MKGKKSIYDKAHIYTRQEATYHIYFFLLLLFSCRQYADMKLNLVRCVVIWKLSASKNAHAWKIMCTLRNRKRKLEPEFCTEKLTFTELIFFFLLSSNTVSFLSLRKIFKVNVGYEGLM